MRHLDNNLFPHSLIQIVMRLLRDFVPRNDNKGVMVSLRGAKRRSNLIFSSILIVMIFFAQTTAQVAETPQTKEEQLRQLKLEQARLEMEQAQARMYKKKADWKELRNLKEQDIVTGQEVNRAKEEFENAKLAFEKVILNLRQIELDSLKAAWHISVVEARRYETKDGKQMISIILENNSQPVKLEYSSKAFERLKEFEKNVSQADREELSPEVQKLFLASAVSPQIDDVFISIMDKNGSIIAQPYEAWIPSLDHGKQHQLQFELIKEEVQDVVVSLKYMDIIEKRDIHLKQEEPYITIQQARQYKSKDDKRRLELVLKYGAVSERAEINTAGEAGEAREARDKGSFPPASPASPAPYRSFPPPQSLGAASSAPTTLPSENTYATELNNIRVSIQDEKGAIIGLPYETTIRTMKYLQEIPLDFELRKNVENIIVALKYLNQESKLHIYLEPDTRRLSIIGAKKYRRSDGQMMASISLKNTSSEMPRAGASEEEIAALNELRSIYVSLKDENVTIIAQPYEARIPLLGYNKASTLEFQLQKDVDEVTVVMQYADVQNDARRVYLQKESEEDIVTISSMRFSQEGYLGSTVTYDLALSRLAEDEKTFTLRIINLLEALTFEFVDLESSSRISQVKFTQAQSRRNLSLVVYIPEELDINLLDKSVDFYVAVLDDKEAEKHGSGNRIQLTDQQLSELKGGKEHLQLILRGVPEMELTSTNLWYDIKTDEQVQLKAKLKNIGTRDLKDIRIVVDVPPDWKKQIEPELVSSLKRQEEREIQILLIPPLKIAPGDYEAKMDAECTIDNRKIEAIEKTIRVHISSRASITSSALLVGGLVVLIGGVAGLSIKLSRR